MISKSIPLSVYAHKTAPTVMVPPREYDFEEFVLFSEKYLNAVLPKGSAPGFIFGLSNDTYRRKESFDSLQALVLDGDKIPLEQLSLSKILAYLTSLQCAYYYTERVSPTHRSFHAIIPFSAPVPANKIQAVRSLHRARAEAALGIPLDKAMDQIQQICFVHTRRPDDAEEKIRTDSLFQLTNPFLPPEQETVRAYAPRTTTPDPAAPLVLQLLLQHDPTAVRLVSGGREKWTFDCPHPHARTQTKTAYFPSTNRIKCFSDMCQGKPLAHFFEAMAPAVANQWFAAHEVALQGLLPDPIPRVTLDQARAAIAKELAAVRSNGTQWTVVRVTTGSGKTHSAIQRFEAESLAAEEDTTPAVLATYSNKIVYEISAGLRAAHRRVVGTLAVLGPDGKPACQRFAEAKPLQDAGVDVVKALCLKCPYREGCPAHAGRETGTGHVTVTNHALVLPVLKKLGGYPRLILDETPPVVEEVVLTDGSLRSLVAQLKRDAQPGDLWGTDGRVFKREVAEAVSGMLPWLERLPFGRARADAEWARLQTTRLGAVTLRETPQKHLAGILGRLAEHGCYACVDPLAHREVMGTFEALGKVMEGTLERVEDTTVAVRLGETAAEWALRGGLILDATAAVDELRAIAPGVRAVDLCVEDAGEAKREMWWTRGCTKSNLAHLGWSLPPDVERRLREYDQTGTTMMVFACKQLKERLRQMFPNARVRHYGESRGSNEAWEETETFVTIGDPLMNVTAFQRRQGFLNMPEGADDGRDFAAAELAQCHGRARTPINVRSVKHVHFGYVVPYGWDRGNCLVRKL